MWFYSINPFCPLATYCSEMINSYSNKRLDKAKIARKIRIYSKRYIIKI
jgi:myosin heavy subunit